MRKVLITLNFCCSELAPCPGLASHNKLTWFDFGREGPGAPLKAVFGLELGFSSEQPDLPYHVKDPLKLRLNGHPIDNDSTERGDLEQS